jgi:dephospho-CoA kinase
MLIIGLTGGIGMGKSAAAEILRGFGLPVYNADHAVHALLRKGGKGVKPVARLFPRALKNGAIDRAVLGQSAFGEPAKLKKLERILHPLARRTEREFLKQARRRKVAAAVLEIPLLFETGAEKRCDVTLCLTASKAAQKARVLRRKGMNAVKLAAILKRQMPDSEKRRRADYVIRTDVSRGDTKRHLRKIIQRLEAKG